MDSLSCLKRKFQLQGDEEKSGIISPANDEEFTGSLLFLTLTIISMSRWYLSHKKL
jgi:hypothetical protein